MFAVDEATAEAIRSTLREHGRLAAAVEFRRHFPGITSLRLAGEMAELIAGWRPPAAPPDAAE